MNVIVVAGICVERDAISAAAANQAELIASLDGVDDVTLVAQAVGRRPSVRAVVASTSWDFLRLDEFAAADVVIYHWGIRYDIFESLPLVAADRRAIVHFHNLTPAHLVPHDARDVIGFSEMQFQLVALANAELWAVSEHNIDRLVEWGFDRDGVRLMPFAIERPFPPTNDRRTNDRVRLLCVGRFVPSKGVRDLVEAMATVASELQGRVSLTLVGDSVLSAGDYHNEVIELIEHTGLSDVIRVRSDVDDAELWRLFDESHVVVSPSYHEGLCVPIVEGYLSGCRAVATDAGNLPYIVQAPDPVVPVARPDLLAEALVRVGREILNGTSHLPAGAATMTDFYSSANVKRMLAEALRR